jgi:hypothetical protein
VGGEAIWRSSEHDHEDAPIFDSASLPAARASGILGEVIAIITRAAVSATEAGEEKIRAEVLDDIGFIPPSERRHAVG